MLAMMTSWRIAFAGYLLFAGSASGTESVTSTVLASATSAWMLVIRRCARRRFPWTSWNFTAPAGLSGRPAW